MHSAFNVRRRRLDQHADASGRGHRLAQYFQAFDVEFRAKDRKARGVATRPGKRKVWVSEQRVGAVHHDGDSIRRGDARSNRFAANCEDRVRVGAYELGGDRRHLVGGREARVDHEITRFGEAKLRKLRNGRFPERAHYLSRRQKRAETVKLFGGLCPYATGQCACATEWSDEFPPSHSITSSARARTAGGRLRPSVCAVLRLMASSYRVGACTGMSAGISPLRTRCM